MALDIGTGHASCPLAENLLGGAVVGGELEHFGIRNHFGEVMDGLEVGASESVDRLCIIAHAKQVALVPERFKKQVLQRVGVLHLVDEDMVVRAGDEGGGRRILFQSHSHFVENIVVVKVMALALEGDIFFDYILKYGKTRQNLFSGVFIHLSVEQPAPEGGGQIAACIDRVGIDFGQLLGLDEVGFLEMASANQPERAFAVLLIDDREFAEIEHRRIALYHFHAP